jgi:hypothetical protein
LLLVLLTSSSLQKNAFTWALSNIPKKIGSRPGCAAPHTVVANHVRSSSFKSKKDGQAHGQGKGPVPGFQLGTESNGFDRPRCAPATSPSASNLR